MNLVVMIAAATGLACAGCASPRTQSRTAPAPAASAPAPAPAASAPAPSVPDPCEGAPLDDCEARAMQYEYGDGVAKDVTKALAMHRRACEADHAPACVQLGQMITGGRGTTADKAAGRRWSERACELGAGAGCASVGFAIDDFSDAAAVEARAWFERGCTLHDAPSCGWMGDHARGADRVPYFRDGCTLGDSQSCERLVRLYANDHVPGLSPADATTALEELCTARVVEACSAAAFRQPDVQHADPWFERGCELGAPDACMTLGRRHAPPRTDSDRLRAATMFRRACSLGDADGCQLADRYERPTKP